MEDPSIESTWGPKPVTDAALGQMVECFLGPVNPSNLSLHSYALANWYRFNHCMADLDFRKELSSLLSETQHQSYTILFEWWTAAYHEPGAILYAILEIVSDAQDLEVVIDEDEWSWTTISRFLQLREWPKDDICRPKKVVASSPTYGDIMMELYLNEFCRIRRSVDGQFKMLRKDAAIAAYVQKGAFLCYQVLHQERILPEQRKEHLTMGSPIDAIRSKTTYSMTEMTRNLSASVTAGPAVQTCTWLNWKIKATVDKSDLPYYLWDSLERRTVKTSELVNIVPYTAISHTWGRWAEYKKPKVRVPGIPWPIYLNTQFDVTSIPRMLSCLHTHEFTGLRVPRYVWFDLACIPQDDHDPIKNREIARQARIFRCATYAVAWFHDVDDFSVLRCILQWMLLQLFYLPAMGDSGRKSVLVAETFESFRSAPSNLLVPKNGPFHFEGSLGMANGWFTSLWTLQELCLRPGMWLCSCNFAPLSICDSIPMPLNGLIVVYDAFTEQILSLQNSLWTDIDHIALWELAHWSKETGMDLLIGMSRTDVLSLGDKRECTSRRAEAIMSVLGATKWYMSSSEDVREKDLVLGKYPLEFVRELQRNLSGELFSAVTKNSVIDYQDGSWDMHEPDYTDIRLATRPVGPKPTGTLLPFHETAVVYVPIRDWAALVDELDTHPTVQHWEVNVSGAVSIHSACILATSDQAVPAPVQTIPVILYGFDLSSRPPLIALDDDRGEWVDLQKWVNTRPYLAYAIVIGFNRMEDGDDGTWGDRVMGALIAGADGTACERLGVSLHFFLIKEYSYLQ